MRAQNEAYSADAIATIAHCFQERQRFHEPAVIVIEVHAKNRKKRMWICVVEQHPFFFVCVAREHTAIKESAFVIRTTANLNYNAFVAEIDGNLNIFIVYKA